MKKRKVRKPEPVASVSPTPTPPPRPEARAPERKLEPVKPVKVTSTSPAAAPAAEDSEPVVRRGAPMPVLLIGLLSVLVYVAGLYVSQTSGGFDPRVFYPYRSVKQLQELQPKSEGEEQAAQGRKVYLFICVQCHMENGQGNPAGFIPPLAGSDWVLAEQPGRLIRIASKGLQGPLKVNGADFGGAAMFAVGDQLPGDEEAKSKQVAAVLTYVRSAWGNKASPVTLERVKQVREKIKDRAEAWTAEELLKIPESD
jgi:mono/diheme cytochrome c family protein